MDVRTSSGESVPTTIILKIGVRRLAEQRARDDRRSLSGYLALLVENHVGADLPGFLRQEPATGASP